MILKRIRFASALASCLFVLQIAPLQAALLLYEPFDYLVGDRLGGAGTSPLGKIAPNGQQWITRSPASGGTYNPANDTLITSGNLSYAGLAPSLGNSVRYGSSANNGAGLYTNAIALPSAVTSGSLYYSFIARLNGAVNGSTRTPWASLSVEPADPNTNAGFGLASAGGTAVDLPAAAWIRNSATTSGEYQLGAGKISTDGMGPSASAPTWQATTAAANQQGNTSGAGQDYATIAQDLYFIVMKYTFNPASSGAGDTVSLWVNPIASTLGDDAGEAAAGAAGGSYYSATNGFVTAAGSDSDIIQSFILIGQANASVASARSIDVSFDELRIGTTWADVTPIPTAEVPEPSAMVLCVVFAGLCSVRRWRPWS